MPLLEVDCEPLVKYLHTCNPQVENLKFILNGSHMSHFHFYLHLAVAPQSHGLHDLALPVALRVGGGKETYRLNTFKINMFSLCRHLFRVRPNEFLWATIEGECFP